MAVVPDTNVLISNLEFLDELLGMDTPYYITIHIAKIVVVELDGLKMTKNEARIATNYIMESGSGRIELEGHMDANKVEIDVGNKQRIKETSNDDKILNYAITLENPVILTNDRLFLIKCKMHNVPAVNLMNNDRYTALKAVFSRDHIEYVSEQQQELNQKLNSFFSEIASRICYMVQEEFGDLYVLNLYNNGFPDLLFLVIQHYNIFRKYLPKNGKTYLIRLRTAILTSNMTEICSSARYVAAMFEIVLKL